MCIHLQNHLNLSSLVHVSYRAEKMCRNYKNSYNVKFDQFRVGTTSKDEALIFTRQINYHPSLLEKFLVMDLLNC